MKLRWKKKSAVAAPPPAPLPGYQHREHRKNGKRQLRRLTIGLIVFAFFYGAFFAFFPPSLIPLLLVPLVILGVMFIWALPTDGRAPVTLLNGLFVGFFISLVIWPNYLAVSIPGLPWITFLRIFGIPMAAVLLICLSRSRLFRGELKAVMDATPWIWKLLAIFVVIEFYTLPFSREVLGSISKFVIAQIDWTLAFFVSCYYFRVRGRMVRWAALMIIMALVVIAIGTWEWHLRRVLWAGHIPSFLSVNDDVVERILASNTRIGRIYRTQSTFTTSLSFAEYLALTTPFVLHFAVEGRRAATRLLAIICVPIIFFGIFITNSRLGAVGFFMSCLLYLVIWAVRRWQTDRHSIFGPAVALGYPAILGTFILASLVNLRLYRMIWGGGEYQYSTDARRQQLEMGIPKILHMPFGHGIGQAATVLGYYQPGGLLTIDNYYLSVALEFGIPGFLVFYGMFIVAMAYGAIAMFRSRSYETSFLIPTVIALANFFIIKSVLSQVANHPLAFMLLGIVAALAYRVKQETAEPGAGQVVIAGR